MAAGSAGNHDKLVITAVRKNLVEYNCKRVGSVKFHLERLSRNR